MPYLIRESNQDDKDLINDFNKELETHEFSFRLTVPVFKHSHTNNFIFEQHDLFFEQHDIIL